MVRLADMKDIEDVASVLIEYRNFYGVEVQDRAEVEAFIRERMENEQSKIFVAQEEDSIIGFIQLYPSFSTVSLKHQWVLNDLYVKQDYRKKGYGTELMMAVKDYFRGKAKGLILITEKNNSTAKAFYNKNGWETGIYDFYTFFY